MDSEFRVSPIRFANDDKLSPSELLNSSYELKINYGLYTNSTNSIAPDNPGGGSGLPVGGYELPYNPSYWNGTRKDKANCYFYVMNEVGTSSDIKTQQLGYLSGNTFNLSIYSTIIEAVEEDVLYLDNVIGFRSSSAGEKPGVDEYKVALVIAPGWDYHWYRQNPDKTWSHIQGHTSVTNVDASGNVIYSLKGCDRNYSDINGPLYNYSIFVGYYIVEH